MIDHRLNLKVGINLEQKIWRVIRNSAFGVSDQVLILKPGCTNTEDGYMLEISDLGSRRIVSSM